jgi:two-component system phosphate regulon sensor histidine kinase PhoR
MPARESERLQLLLEVGRLLSSKLELTELLTTVLELAARVVDAETASLLLLDERTQELYFDLALGVDPALQKVRLKLGQGIAGAVAQTRTPAVINDARNDPRWSQAMDAQSGFVTRSILAVPIILKGKLLGVIEAINKRGGPLQDEDVAMFEAFASQVGVAIENARMFAFLRDERFKLAAVFEHMQDGAVLADDSGRVVLANDAARRLLGVEFSNIKSALSSFEVVPPMAEMTGTAAFTATRREPTLLVIAGRSTPALLTETQGHLWVFRDETEATRQERLKRSFLSLISHKLKTPLTSVIGFSDYLLADMGKGKTDPTTLKALQTINQQGVKVGELVDKLVRYTTLESPDAKPNFTEIDVDAAIAEAIKSLRDRVEAKQAVVDYSPSGAKLSADRDMFVEIVKNLVENSLKFDPRPAPVVSVGFKDGAEARLSVSDLGPGIPPEEQEAVFSRFHQVEKDFTGQTDGIGLGLPFVKKVAELHGAAVSLRSKLGEGTTVTVLFPRQRP